MFVQALEITETNKLQKIIKFLVSNCPNRFLNLQDDMFTSEDRKLALAYFQVIQVCSNPTNRRQAMYV